MSENTDIQALLEKFWEGETTLEEERQLKGYFASRQVDGQLQQYAPLFKAIREEQNVQLNKPKVVPMRPASYNWQGWAVAASVALLLAAGAWWLFSAPADVNLYADKPEVPQEMPEVAPEKKAQAEKPLVAQAEIAGPKKNFRKKKHLKEDKPSRINAEEAAAMEEIKAALALVSSKIRKGRHEAAKGAEHLENIDKIFKRKEG